MLRNYPRLRHISIPWTIARMVSNFCATLPLQGPRWTCLRGTWMLQYDAKTDEMTCCTVSLSRRLGFAFLRQPFRAELWLDIAMSQVIRIQGK